ncbi:ATP-dependent DNA ligase [Micromonospora tarensis]|uniref:ATP-dependent DNA ligase n=1 Tax=Micromonospora tarensis TaxID=2806100 RepID=UPI002102A393|nr:hypothetical protein [Micromonospora tarensis]
MIVFEHGRTNFAQLQRRVTAGRGLLRLASECPAHYVLFDLLADVGGRPLLNLPLSQRRARLQRLLADAPPQLVLTPQTTDMREVWGWLTTWTVATGIEGVLQLGFAVDRLTAGFATELRGQRDLADLYVVSISVAVGSESLSCRSTELPFTGGDESPEAERVLSAAEERTQQGAGGAGP